MPGVKITALRDTEFGPFGAHSILGEWTTWNGVLGACIDRVSESALDGPALRANLCCALP